MHVVAAATLSKCGLPQRRDPQQSPFNSSNNSRILRRAPCLFPSSRPSSLATQHQLGQTIFGFESDTVCHTETYMTAMHTIPPGYPLTAVFPDKGVIYSAIVAGRSRIVSNQRFRLGKSSSFWP